MLCLYVLEMEQAQNLLLKHSVDMIWGSTEVTVILGEPEYSDPEVS